MTSVYEVLNPWAEADPIPLRGISPRLPNLDGKKIGLYMNSKVGAPIILDAVEQQLNNRYPTISFKRFRHFPNMTVAETKHRPEFENWIKEVDAVIFAVGD